MCPAKSEHQQKFMGMVHALQKGELKPDEVSASVRKAAASMKSSDAKDYASTKHKGLPAKVKKEAIQPSTAHGYTKDGIIQFAGSAKVARQKMKQNNDSRETYVKESRKIHYSTG